jgi:ankyrin repeat protein
MDGAEQQLGTRLVAAIRLGDLTMLDEFLTASPELAAGRVHGGRTALHVVTDWPGYFPNGPQIARRLLDAGADPNAVTEGKGAPETALHWAASTDDVDVAEVLIEAGADLETPGGSIGTPLANAVGYGCWNVARLLVSRGARVDQLWQAAGIGLSGRVEEMLAAVPAPDNQATTDAFWQACSRGQRRTAMLLLARGADINGRPGYAGRSAIEAAAGPDTRRDLLVGWLRDSGATGIDDEVTAG